MKYIIAFTMLILFNVCLKYLMPTLDWEIIIQNIIYQIIGAMIYIVIKYYKTKAGKDE